MFARDGVDARDRLQGKKETLLSVKRARLFSHCFELLLGKLGERRYVVLVCEDVHIDVQGELTWSHDQRDREKVVTTGVVAIGSSVIFATSEIPLCNVVVVGGGVFVIGTDVLTVISELIIVTAVEEVHEAGDAGFGVDGEVDDAFLGFLAP